MIEGNNNNEAVLSAERALLGCLMLDPVSIAAARAIVSPADFLDARHAAIFQASCDLSDAAKTIDPLTVAAQMKANGVKGVDIVFLSDLPMAVPFTGASFERAEEYAEIGYDAALRRRLKLAADRISAAMSAGGETRELCDQAEQAVMDATRSRRRTTAISAREATHEYSLHLEKVLRTRNFLTGVPTGFDRLDRMTQGMQPGDVILLAARPSVGKTALALNIARNAARKGVGKSVAFFSLEMSHQQLMARMVAAEAVVDGWRLSVGVANESEIKRVADACGTLAELPITVDDGLPLTTSQLRSVCRRLQVQGKLDLIVVDYIGLLQPVNSRDNRVAQVAAMSGDLKALARELNVPVLALSQLSRGVEQRGSNSAPMLSDLRDSGALEQDADLVWFLHRKPTDTQDAVVPVDLIVAKHRNGPVGMIPLMFNQPSTLFTERAPVQPASSPVADWSDRIAP